MFAPATCLPPTREEGQGQDSKEPAGPAGGATTWNPEEREALTTAQLLQRFVDLYLQPYGVELDPAHLRLVQRGKELEPEALVTRGAISLKLAPEVGTTEKEVLELLRSRIERRFRPDTSR